MKTLEVLNSPSTNARVRGGAADRRVRDAPIDLRGPGGRAPRGRAGQGHQSGPLRPASPTSARHVRLLGGQLTNVSGTLYFSADDGRHGHELWRSDGTARGTRMVKDINPGRGWGNFSGITPWTAPLLHGRRRRPRRPSSGEVTAPGRGRGWSRTSTPAASRRACGLTDVGGTLYFAESEGNHVSEGCGEATAPRRGRPWSRR